MAEDFYVDPIDCMGCGYPPILAPDLMEFAKSDEGYWQCRFSGSHKINQKWIRLVRQFGAVVAEQQRTKAKTNGSSNTSQY